MKGRRGNGEGSIFFEEERNRWIGQISIADPGSGKRSRPKVTGKSRTEVARKLKELRDQEGVAASSSRVRTVGELLDLWFETAAAAKLGPGSTLDNYGSQIDKHIKPKLGRLRLDKVTAEDIDRFLLSMAADGYSRSTLVKLRSVLRQAFRWGVKRRHISWDPAALAEMPSQLVFDAATPKQVRKARALTPDEARRFVAATLGRRNGIALQLALVLGLRPGELTALTWGDVDLDTGTVTVSRAWKGKGAHRHLGPPKTRGSARSLGIPEKVVAGLRVHRIAQLEERVRAGEWHDTHDLVFTTRSGRPIDPANLRWLARAVAEDAGVGKVAPYDLRHSAASILSELGVRNEHLADLLGHVDTRMVERHYRHRLGTSVDVAVAPMGELLA